MHNGIIKQVNEQNKKKATTTFANVPLCDYNQNAVNAKIQKITMNLCTNRKGEDETARENECLDDISCYR